MDTRFGGHAGCRSQAQVREPSLTKLGFAAIWSSITDGDETFQDEPPTRAGDAAFLEEIEDHRPWQTLAGLDTYW